MYYAKDYATELFDKYMREHGDPRDLSFRQVDTVIRAIQQTNFTRPATIEDVASIIEEKFPQEDEMFRPGTGYKPSTQQNPTSTKPSEATQIITHFLNEKYWERVAPLAIPPITEDGTAIRSAINWKAFLSAIHENTVAGKGKHPVRHDILSTIVINLDQDKLLEHYPQTVERIVEVEKKVPLTRREEVKEHFKLDKVMNRAESPIKGIGEQVQKKPVVSEAELAQVAAHDLEQNWIMGDINAKIAQHAHHGRSHSATTYERKILENIRDAGIRAGLPNEQIAKQIDAKRSEMTKWDAQQALRQLRPELFTSQPKTAGY